MEKSGEAWDCVMLPLAPAEGRRPKATSGGQVPMLEGLTITTEEKYTFRRLDTSVSQNGTNDQVWTEDRSADQQRATTRTGL